MHWKEKCRRKAEAVKPPPSLLHGMDQVRKSSKVESTAIYTEWSYPHLQITGKIPKKANTQNIICLFGYLSG